MKLISRLTLVFTTIWLAACVPAANPPTATEPTAATPTAPVSMPTPTPEKPFLQIAFKQIECSTYFGDLAFSPDGAWLAAEHAKSIQICDTQSFERQSTILLNRGLMISMSWSPDSTKLAVGLNSGDMQIWEAATGKLLHGYPLTSEPAWGLAWSPEGNMLATGSGSDTLDIWDVSTGSKVRTIRSQQVTYVAWSPDGKQVAGGCACGVVHIWSAEDGSELAYLAAGVSGASVTAVAWSRDGKRFAYGLRDIYVHDSTTGELLATLGGGGYSLAWSPDGKWIASDTLNGLRIWDTFTGDVILSYEQATRVGTVAWSPLGDYLVIASVDGVINVWDTAQLSDSD